MTRKDFIIGKSLLGMRRIAEGGNTVNWSAANSSQGTSKYVIKQISSRDKSSLKKVAYFCQSICDLLIASAKVFHEDTSIRSHILLVIWSRMNTPILTIISDENILQICGIGRISDESFYQVFHFPCANLNTPLTQWYCYHISQAPDKLALQLTHLVSRLTALVTV